MRWGIEHREESRDAPKLHRDKYTSATISERSATARVQRELWHTPRDHTWCWMPHGESLSAFVSRVVDLRRPPPERVEQHPDVPVRQHPYLIQLHRGGQNLDYLDVGGKLSTRLRSGRFVGTFWAAPRVDLIDQTGEGAVEHRQIQLRLAARLNKNLSRFRVASD